MTGMLLRADIRGVSVLGPGLPDWAAAEAVLAGRMAYSPMPVSLPMTAGLPPAERRRTGAVVRLAIAPVSIGVVSVSAETTCTSSVAMPSSSATI